MLVSSRNDGKIRAHRYNKNGFQAPHYDSLKSFYHEQSASVVVFLNDVPEGGELIFPAAKPPIKIRPKKGMGVVWHNSDENGNLDNMSIHGEMRVKGNDGAIKYTAKKWIYSQPLSKTRSVVLPLLFFINGGKAPVRVRMLYNSCLKKWGADKGYERFDQLVLAFCAFLAWVILSLVNFLRRSSTGGEEEKTNAKEKGE